MILITMGDPAGVGPEVLLKSLSSVRPEPFDKLRAGSVEGRTALTVIGDLGHLRRLSRRLGIVVPWRRFEWIDLGDLTAGVRPGTVQARAGRAAFACLEEAVRLLKAGPPRVREDLPSSRAGQAQGLVTAPVSKEAIVRAGISWKGHTEYLAERFRCRTTMMFVTGRFRVGLVTTHEPLRAVPARISRSEVVRAARQMVRALQRDFGIARPRIGLAALNPHAGEGGLFGSEERRILRPAVLALQGKMEGPIPADVLMEAAARGEYDGVVALYHDQALIPVKLLGWGGAVNVTLGLPFVRTSPVHGTAFDLAGKGKADPSSMKAALTLAIQLARRKDARM